jgi:hypothetical protein
MRRGTVLRDPSAHKLRSGVEKWIRTDYQRMTVI